MKRRFCRMVWMGLVAATLACAPPDDRSEASSEASRYQLDGTIVGADQPAGTVTIEHEAIGDFMAAMTMPFNVRDPWVFGVADAGARIRATLVVDDESSWLEDVVITQPPSAGAARKAVIPKPREGEAVPDVELVDQDGVAFTLDDYRGGTLVFTFIYTRCPLPDYCPRMSENLNRVHDAIVAEPDRYGASTRLLSVSLDPDYDTPAVLREYGLRYVDEGADAFERWRFASPADAGLRTLAQFAGVRFVPEEGTISHSLRTVVVDAGGHVLKTHVGNTWQPAELLADLEAAAAASGADEDSAGS